MLENTVAVSILTNSDRRCLLEPCVHSILSDCYYRPLTVAVFDNGSTDDTWDWLREAAARPAYGISWRLDRSVVDVGCAAGSNRVADMVRDHKYVLHVESDFFHLGVALTAEDKLWMHRAVRFMDNNPCDYLYLRRMVTHRDIFFHWWAQWMRKIDLAASTPPYLRCPDFWWSNNPHLRRNDAIYEAGCLPLDERSDAKKGEPGWSGPEMKAPRPGNAWIHQWGLFVHEAQHFRGFQRLRGCGKVPLVAGVHCKYGFFKDGSDLWCQCCYRDRGFDDMAAHVRRFEEMM